jgi:hypothetical protein
MSISAIAGVSRSAPSVTTPAAPSASSRVT